MMWLTNSIIKLEQIPPSLKSGIIIPVCKGGGKEDVNSYRGITLNSGISKVLEHLICLLPCSLKQAYHIQINLHIGKKYPVQMPSSLLRR